MRWLFVVAFLLAFSFHCRNARASTGNEWKDTCDKQNDALEVGFCDGEIKGVIEGLGTGLQTPQSPQRRLPFCMPQGVTQGQAKDVVYKYVVDHPEQRHLNLADLALYALITAFPCKGH
jgi:hypothetical protein